MRSAHPFLREFDDAEAIEPTAALAPPAGAAGWKHDLRLSEARSAWALRDMRRLAAILPLLGGPEALPPTTAARGGVALFALHRFAEALPYLERAQRDDPTPDRALTLARARAAAGHIDEALAGLDQVPEGDFASFLREALQRIVALRGAGDAASGVELAERLLGLGQSQACLETLTATLARPGAGDRLKEVCALAALAMVRVELGASRVFVAAVAEALDAPEGAFVAASAAGGSGRPGPEIGWPAGLVAARSARLEGRLDHAVEILDVLASRHLKNSAVRDALAQSVGELALAERPVVFGAPRADGRPRVIDMFPFSSEFSMLEIKLNEMAPWVDLFVAVEARFTYTGQPKPLHLSQALAEGRFAAVRDKIRIVVVEGCPNDVASPWTREFHQRDVVFPQVASLVAPEDIVLLTDADEIVRDDVPGRLLNEVAGLRLETSRYFLNLRPVRGDRRRAPLAAAACRARVLARHGWSHVRFTLARQSRLAPALPDAGWHFSSISNARGLAEKILTYSHQELARRDEAFFERRLTNLRLGALSQDWERVEIDDSFPAYVRGHVEELAEVILPAPDKPEP